MTNNNHGEPDAIYSGKPPHNVFKKIMPDGEMVSLPLEPSLKLVNKSPSGFSWGYCGSGPSQLALALLLDATSVPQIAEAYAYDFKMEFVATWPGSDEWLITRSMILSWVDKVQAEEAARRVGVN